MLASLAYVLTWFLLIDVDLLSTVVVVAPSLIEEDDAMDSMNSQGTTSRREREREMAKK